MCVSAPQMGSLGLPNGLPTSATKLQFKRSTSFNVVPKKYNFNVILFIVGTWNMASNFVLVMDAMQYQ